MRKKISFIDSSLEDLRAFPEEARTASGYQLDLIQQGLEPDDWKHFATVGQGAREIRIRGNDGIFRIMYVAKFEEAVYVCTVSRKRHKRPARVT
ncbi:type II toxin-antitoxin system RelE/ParE family toxin [Pantoea agglomerans]